MRRRLLFLLPLALCFAYGARAALTNVNFGVGAASQVAFTPLHIYYMSPTGSDSNSGTSPSSPWATPNHPVDCGDVIIAAPGAYSPSGMGVTSQPSNCPSNSSGIDGSGGIYFAVVLCNGNVGACHVDGSGGSGGAIEVGASNWAFEGWQVSSKSIGSSGMRGFEVNACASGTTVIHHVAFVNDVATHLQEGFDTNECALNHNVPGNGVDYFAVVGSIAQNANDDPICVAAIDDVAPANLNSDAGVHVFFGGNFAIANRNPACPGSDGEGIMLDTWDAHGYVGTGVIENNIIYDSAWAGLQIFEQNINTSNPQFQVFDNTLYANEACTEFSVGTSGELNIQLDGGYPWTLNVYNNIALTNRKTVGCKGGGNVYAMHTGGVNGVGSTTMNIGGSGLQNIFKGEMTSCDSTCDSGNNVVAFNGFGVGTDTYENPGFANTSDLLANQVGAPDCSSSYTNTTACMGWNNSTQRAAANSVIADLTPTASGTSGKGYQPPGACKPDQYYPTWLKGIVYLQWDGTNLWEYNGLVQKPCGL